MTLNEFASRNRLDIFADLQNGRTPSIGTFDVEVLKSAKSKGSPQMGATTYSQNKIAFEFVYPDSRGISVILRVLVDAPQRIVFLPVPEWVIENIWQGEIGGSFHFESDAAAMMERLHGLLEPVRNTELFGLEPPKIRG